MSVMDKQTAEMLHRLLKENLEDRQRLRYEREQHLRMIQLRTGAGATITPETPPPQTPTRLPDPDSILNGASLSRSNSSASRSTAASSDGMSTPPSQLSTPSSECPPLSRNRTPQPQESFRLAGAVNYTRGDRLVDDM